MLGATRILKEIETKKILVDRSRYNVMETKSTVITMALVIQSRQRSDPPSSLLLVDEVVISL